MTDGLVESTMSIPSKARLLWKREATRLLRLQRGRLYASPLLRRSNDLSPESYFVIVGHPRSGSTLLAALLDAHHDVGVAHEAEILKECLRGATRESLLKITAFHCEEFRRQGFRWEGYDYKVGEQQGSPGGCRVLGDKSAGRSSEVLASDPDAIARLSEALELPVATIVLERNPLDVVATMLRKGRAYSGEQEALDRHIKRVSAVSALAEQQRSKQLLILHHADLCADTEVTIRSALGLLGTEADDTYIGRCIEVVDSALSRPSLDRSWEPSTLARCRELCQQTPRLARYLEELAEVESLAEKNAVR